MTMIDLKLAAALIIGSAVLTFAALILLRPLLRRYALARPVARSSHKEPTPQGGGLGIVAATIIAASGAALHLGLPLWPMIVLFIAAAFLALVGAIDDILTVPVLPRLVAQIAAIAILIAAIPSDFRVFPWIPFWPERLLLAIASLWLVNLVNFMDGIDWMIVAEVVPVAGGLALVGCLGILPAGATIIALALLGAMIGFAPFNKPVARVFLGDVGSLPIGLLLAYLLIVLAGRGHIVAALLLPLYYLADATITLIRRILRGEKIWIAHRDHFYQRALDFGMPVWSIIFNVVALNFALVALATASVLIPSAPVLLAAAATGTALVGYVLFRFSQRTVS